MHPVQESFVSWITFEDVEIRRHLYVLDHRFLLAIRAIEPLEGPRVLAAVGKHGCYPEGLAPAVLLHGCLERRVSFLPTSQPLICACEARELTSLRHFTLTLGEGFLWALPRQYFGQ